MSLIQAESVTKTYTTGEVRVEALKGLNFSIAPASFAAFIGPSGSGKSTLLNLIGCLDKPSSGTLRVADTDVSQLDRQQSATFRGKHLGFIFQDFNLFPVLTVAENIEYPLLLVQSVPGPERKKRVTELLEAVGMLDQRNKYPDQISGGQKQRVAVARALVTKPRLVLADEPTANLDHATAHMVIDTMRKMKDEFGTTFLFSTHDPKVVGEVDELFTLEDGLLVQHEDRGTDRKGAAS